MSVEVLIIFLHIVFYLIINFYAVFLCKRIQDLETKYEWQCKRIDSLSDALIATNKVLDRIIKEKDDGNN